jgi:hypothetical protein
MKLSCHCFYNYIATCLNEKCKSYDGLAVQELPIKIGARPQAESNFKELGVLL